MSLSDISIKNPVFAWMLMAALIIFGFISYGRMGVGQLPDVDFPVVSVSLTWEGAAPEVMESDVVDIVEDSIMSIQGVRDVSSSIRQGAATITVEFDLDRDIDVAMQDTKTKIDQAQRQLPNDIDPPVLTKVNPEDNPILMLTVSSAERNLPDLITYVQDHLKDQFTTVKGVGDIFLGGFVDRNLRIWVDANKLEAYQLTVKDVIDAVQKEHQEVPAGRIETTTKEFNVRLMGEAPTTDEFANILIPTRSGKAIYKPIYLKDVATVEYGLADVRRIARTMGRATVGLGIRKQRGSNEIDVAHRVLKRLEEVRIGTFIVVYFMGFTLNTFTVLGLSLAVGIVVDDAIMVLENIVRHRERGQEKVTAARDGARQITFAAMAATIALIAIFLPVAFMSGIIGKFFFQFGVTISVAVALSLLEALTLTPMRCSQFLQVGERHTRFGKAIDGSFKWLAKRYHTLLEKALGRKKIVIAFSLVFFITSLFFFKLLRKEFVPSQDLSILMCRLQTPVGSSLELTSDRFKAAEGFITNRPEVEGYVAIIGGVGGGEVNSGMIFVTFKEPFKRPVVPPARHRLSQTELMALLRTGLNKIPDIRATIQDLSLSGFSAQRGFPIEFSVRGPDWEKLASCAEQIRKEMGKSSLMADVDTDYFVSVPEIQVKPDRKKADERGVSIDVIGNTVNSLIGGERIAKYTKDGRRYDVRVRLVASQRTQVSDIEKLWVWNNRNELVQLKDIITVEEKLKPLTITRRNRERAISIFANVATGKSQTDAIREVENITKKILPEGYRIVFSGSTQTFKESFSNLILVFWLGILVAYMVLASQFNSYVHPISVLLALPFSISGALVSLWVFGQSLNIYSIIGLILLMGIVKKNSILLVDFTNQMRRQNMNVKAALLKACPIRLRPILMTSMATITAAIPPALALGPGAETRVPMAITVIGGVILSTMLTLFVVPCVYMIFAKLEKKGYNVVSFDETEPV
ncbi:MAG: efflux RND transporter permease subunit [Candidatus Omnitrophica bacterium]|nr:efflux RND transporter permease subunit [Candidatus Omnitrophota bacterium]